MRTWMRTLFLTAVLALGMSLQTFAATAITSVSLTVSDEIKVGEEVYEDSVTVTAGGSRYYVDGVEIMNENPVWGPSDTPVIEVTLQAEEQYYFSVKASDGRVKGASYIRGRRTEDSQSVTVALRLPSLSDQVGEIEEAQWSSATVGTWSKSYNVSGYEVYLYRDGKSAGKIQDITDTSYDFASKMLRPGNYTFKVRAWNVRDKNTRSEWKEAAGTSIIDEKTAQQLYDQYGVEIPEGIDGPGELQEYLAQQNQQTGWILDHVGWWYRNSDGSYTTSNWQLIDGKWYYFDSVGYMVTGWIDWNGKSYYCNPGSGEMLVSTIVPDGTGRRVDSTGAWIQ